MLEICLVYTYCDVKCTYPSWKFFPKTVNKRNNGMSLLYDIYTVYKELWLSVKNEW